ncbi:MAG: NAD(P)H-binding protein [Panacagrimonas sp.]
MTRIAIIAGHTGLVGRKLLERLLADNRYSRVVAIGRRAPPQQDARLEVLQSDLTDLRQLESRLAADDAYCCLGTTQRAAGSKAAFERVDFHMVVDFARAVRAAGAKRFFVVSSLSADPKSPIYYSRVKGRAEQALREIGFETLHIVQPSLLLGSRTERRPGEALAQKLGPLLNRFLIGPLTKYKAIAAEDVAAALMELSRREALGVQVHTLPLKP